MGDLSWLGQFGGWLVGLLTVIGTILFNSRKVKVDESALVLAKWKEFAEIHQADMKRLKEEIDKDRSRYEGELDGLRARLRDVEKELAEVRKHSAEQILVRDKEIASLQRELSQISQSTAVQIGRVKTRAKKTDDTVEEHDAANTADHSGMRDVLNKLGGGIGGNSRGRTDNDEGDRE